MNDLLKNLNDEQIEAVKHNEGPCLVLAGAGSGKTKVLTNRIAYLIENGVRDYNILAITFTNKAAKEMRDRVYNLVGDVASFIGTFHSLGLRIIRENCGYLNLPSNFSIIDSDDVLTVINKAEQNNYDNDNNSKYTVSVVVYFDDGVTVMQKSTVLLRKTSIFECVKMEYNSDTGRVNYVEFRLKE